jgi:hypothetical protein
MELQLLLLDSMPSMIKELCMGCFVMICAVVAGDLFASEGYDRLRCGPDAAAKLEANWLPLVSPLNRCIASRQLLALLLQHPSGCSASISCCQQLLLLLSAVGVLLASAGRFCSAAARRGRSSAQARRTRQFWSLLSW